MKNALILSVMAAVALAPYAAFGAEEAKPAGTMELKTDTDKVSYALGNNFGTFLKSKGITDLNKDAMLRGILDITEGKPLALTEEQSREVLTNYSKALSSKKLEEGKAFLEANGKKEGVKTLPSGLQYKVIKEGAGPMPKASDTVKTNYKGTLIDGTVFDASEKHGGPATFEVGGVIKGWTEALQLMKVGSKWQLFVPSDLAYGARGAGGDIGPNATLIFEIELLSIEKPADAAPGKPDAGTLIK